MPVDNVGTTQCVAMEPLMSIGMRNDQHVGLGMVPLGGGRRLSLYPAASPHDGRVGLGVRGSHPSSVPRPSSTSAVEAAQSPHRYHGLAVRVPSGGAGTAYSTGPQLIYSSTSVVAWSTPLGTGSHKCVRNTPFVCATDASSCTAADGRRLPGGRNHVSKLHGTSHALLQACKASRPSWSVNR